MDSDLAPDEGEDEAKKSSGRILQHELVEGVAALDRSTGRLLVSGLSAGLDIGFSVLLIAVMRTSAEGVLAPPVIQLLLAGLYSFGFIVVVLGRSELFTEQTTLSVLPWLNGQASLASVARLWITVYFSNLVGASLFAALVALAIPHTGQVDSGVLAGIAEETVSHPWWVIVVSGILAGWMMGLLSWLVAAGRDTISQIVIVWLITSGIGLTHLHHSIVGTVEVLAGIFAGGPTTYSEFGRFLWCATLGNAIGGSVLVALIKYGHSRPSSHP